MNGVREATVEAAALHWLRELGYRVEHAPEPSRSGLRDTHAAVVLSQLLWDRLAHLNPDLPPEAVEDAYRKLTAPEGATLETRNRSFHRMLVDGVPVEYRHADGTVRGGSAFVVDFEDPANNDFLAVSQFTVVENTNERRPDIVLFLNGLPLGVIELKNPADEDATIWSAWQQLQTYKSELPTLFAFNEFLIVSDGTQARLGTLTSGREWFKPWRTISGQQVERPAFPNWTCCCGVSVTRRGCSPSCVTSSRSRTTAARSRSAWPVITSFMPLASPWRRRCEPPGSPTPRYRSGATSPGRTREGLPATGASALSGTPRAPGKSLTMVFYAGAVIREPAMENPTVVVLTDRNDLDDQLFGTFSRCSDLLRQPPVQAESRADLRHRLAVRAGGVVFTTVQKFFPDEKGGRHPLLSERRNIVVIADEAHRSQYDFIDGYAHHMREALPNASFIGFTGTPIERKDANTRAVFGEHISIYDIQRAVEDGATVPIYYESRLASLALDEEERPLIDPGFGGSHRGRRGCAQGAAENEMGATGGRRRG